MKKHLSIFETTLGLGEKDPVLVVIILFLCVCGLLVYVAKYFATAPRENLAMYVMLGIAVLGVCAQIVKRFLQNRN